MSGRAQYIVQEENPLHHQRSNLEADDDNNLHIKSSDPLVSCTYMWLNEFV